MQMAGGAMRRRQVLKRMTSRWYPGGGLQARGRRRWTAEGSATGDAQEAAGGRLCWRRSGSSSEGWAQWQAALSSL